MPHMADFSWLLFLSFNLTLLLGALLSSAPSSKVSLKLKNKSQENKMNFPLKW